MSRLPTPGDDNGTWGTILNDYLSQSHNSDGTIKTAAVTTAGAITGTESATAPSNPKTNDLWYDTTNDIWKRWNGTQWQPAGITQANLTAQLKNYTPQGLPSYAGAAVNAFDPATGQYNKTGSNTRFTRQNLGKALAGTGIMDIVFFGDSLLVGWNGSAYKDAASIPRQAAKAMSAMTGLPIVGTGVVPCVAGGTSNVPNDLWSSTGSVDFGTYFPGICVMTSGATLTYTSQQAGTKAQIFYGDNGQSFTYKIDGGTATAITVGSTSALKMVQATGLANTTHTITITATGNYANIYGVAIDGASSYGLRVHNIALGGSTASTGGAAQNWNDTSNGFYGFSAARRSMLTLAGITPAVAVCSIGGNDIAYGSSVSAIVSGIASMRGFWSSADFVRVQSYTDSSTTNVGAFLQAMYGQADSLGFPLIDWQSRVGDKATAIANGDLGPDNIHPAWGSGAVMGRAVGAMLAT